MIRNVLAVYFAGQFINLLRKDFRQWKAYRLGIIDSEGDIIKNPSTPNEHKVFTKVHRLVIAVKKPLARVGMSGIAAVYTGYKTFVEEYDIDSDTQTMILESIPELGQIHESMVAGDSGGDPDKMASGENSGAVVGLGAGRRNRKKFIDWIDLEKPNEKL